MTLLIVLFIYVVSVLFARSVVLFEDDMTNDWLAFWFCIIPVINLIVALIFLDFSKIPTWFFGLKSKEGKFTK